MGAFGLFGLLLKIVFGSLLAIVLVMFCGVAVVAGIEATKPDDGGKYDHEN